MNSPAHIGSLDPLPDVHRHVLELLSLGMPHREIAAELDLPIEALDPLISVARAKLRRTMLERAVPRDGSSLSNPGGSR